MLEYNVEVASNRICEAVMGNRLLQLFKGVTGNKDISVSNKEDTSLLTGRVKLAGFREAGFHAYLEAGSVNARFIINGERSQVIVIETGSFNAQGKRITEFNEDGAVDGLEHLIAVSNEKKGWQPWDSEGLLYDRMLAAVKGYARLELGEEQAKAKLFYRD